MPTRTVTAATTALPGETLFCDATGGAFAVILPTAGELVGRASTTLIKVDASANTVTLTGTVNGAVNPTLANQYDTKTVGSNGVSLYYLPPPVTVATSLKAWTVDMSLPRATLGLPNGANWASAARITVDGSWTVSKLGMVVGVQSGNLALAAFHDNGADAPGTLIATTGSVACPAVGSRTVALVGGSFALKTGDWLALAADNLTAKWASGGVDYIGGANLPTWRSIAWNLGSLNFASNPAGLSADARVLALWGE